jgi:tellurite resistance protein TerC
MRTSSETHVIRLDVPWEKNAQMLQEKRFSRYPLVEGEGGRPIGVIHVKNIPFEERMKSLTDERIRRIARPCFEFCESLSLEEALGRFQLRYDRLALVNNEKGEWTGILTFEDLVQEIIGNMGDEFDQARAGEFISLVEALSVDRIVLDMHAESLQDAVEQILSKIASAHLPTDPKVIRDTVLRKKDVMPIYAGNGVAIPHGRFSGISRPILAFARCDLGVPIDDSSERAELIFLLMTPSGKARMQSRLLANINALFKSEYVSERLRKSQSPDAVIEAIRAGQQVSLD